MEPASPASTPSLNTLASPESSTSGAVSVTASNTETSSPSGSPDSSSPSSSPEPSSSGLLCWPLTSKASYKGDYKEGLNVVGDARSLDIVSDTIDCIVTSPPYNVGIDYKHYEDVMPWVDYEILAIEAAAEMYRVLRFGGRAWVNVQPTVPHLPGNNSQRVDLEQLWKRALDLAGLKYRDTIAWVQDSFDGACAWGSWLRPSAPNQRGGWESIISVYKDTWKRTPPEQYKGWKGERHDLGGDWGNDLCRNVWKMKPQRATPDAPAPFPIELPARCIRLSTWPGEYVLDPFGGSGTTARVATQLGRVGISVDLH